MNYAEKLGIFYLKAKASAKKAEERRGSSQLHNFTRRKSIEESNSTITERNF